MANDDEQSYLPIMRLAFSEGMRAAMEKLRPEVQTCQPQGHSPEVNMENRAYCAVCGVQMKICQACLHWNPSGRIDCIFCETPLN